MNTLKEVLAQIEEKEAEAKVHPEEVNPNVRAGVEAMVRNAQASLEGINTTYRDLVMNNVVIIGVTGKTAKQFATQAEALGAVSVDFNLIKGRLVTALKRCGQGDLYTSAVAFALNAELGQIKRDYNMISLPPPQITGYNQGIYDAPLQEAVDKIVDIYYGSQLQSAVTRREIGKLALALRFVGQKLPVVVYNLDKDVDTTFIPNPVSQLVSDKEVTEELVTKQLVNIKKMINKKSNKTGQEATEGETNEHN